MEGGGERVGRDRVLGVVGTFVLDRIVGLPGRPEPAEGLGGIAYTLSAAPMVPPGWRFLPIARVGADVVASVRSWLGELGLDTDALREVPEANNRVELRYHDGARRTERLTGGVRGWSGAELAAVAVGCDALLVNFISGHELSLEEALALRSGFDGPIYADLHSLFLGRGDDGIRVPRGLPEWREWMTCFDAIQLNEDEMDLLRGEEEATAMARRVVSLGPNLIACTRGAAGAVCWTVDHAPPALSVPRRTREDDGSVVRHEIPAYPVVHADPTGCGDVWAGVMCSRLLAGDAVADAAEAANRLAAVAAGQSGVSGLAHRLSDEANTKASAARGPREGNSRNGEEGS